MKKKYVLAAVMALAMGMAACSLGAIEEQPDSEAIAGSQTANDSSAETLTYRGVQGDEEHPGIAVKVVAESIKGIPY